MVSLTMLVHCLTLQRNPISTQYLSQLCLPWLHLFVVCSSYCICAILFFSVLANLDLSSLFLDIHYDGHLVIMSTLIYLIFSYFSSLIRVCFQLIANYWLYAVAIKNFWCYHVKLYYLSILACVVNFSVFLPDSISHHSSTCTSAHLLKLISSATSCTSRHRLDIFAIPVQCYSINICLGLFFCLFSYFVFYYFA